MSEDNEPDKTLLIPIEHAQVTVTSTRSKTLLHSIDLQSAIFRCRYARLCFAISLGLIVAAFLFFWTNEESSVFSFYDYQPTRKQEFSFAGFDEGGNVSGVLKPRVKATTPPTLPFTPKSIPEFLANQTKYDKYMLTNVGEGACGGVGNVIFRVAALYGIGRHLRRNACLQGACAEEYHIELYSMFPNLQKFPLLRHCWPQDSKGVNFAGNCWNYDNVSNLEQYSDHTFINLHTSYLQSHKFFHYIRHEILYMFDFSSSMKGLVDDYAQQMFDGDNSTKICAHIRQGDFKGGHPLLPSTEIFTINGLNFLIANVALNQSSDNVSVLLFSDDLWFANGISRQIREGGIVRKAFVTRELNRLENMALGARHCDYFLITSSGSTFGWWMAYLLPDEKQSRVFYNSMFFKQGNEGTAKGFHEADFFPPEWNRLILDREHNEITVQNRSIPAIMV